MELKQVETATKRHDKNCPSLAVDIEGATLRQKRMTQSRIQEDGDSSRSIPNAKEWQQFKQKAEQEMKGILLLEHLALGAQGSVQVGYITASKQMVAIKHVNHKDDYEFEKSAYQLLATKNLSHLSMKLLNTFDEQQYLVIERGSCDLDTFTKLRAQNNDPLDANEFFLILHTVVSAMRDLHSINMSFCDMKGANLLMKYNFEKMGYTPVLTDLGGVYCPEIDRERVYGELYTPLYFDATLMDKLENGHEPSESEIVHSELFTICRTILHQILITHQDEEQYSSTMQLFKDQRKQWQHQQFMKKFCRSSYQKLTMKYVGQTLGSVLMQHKFNDFDSFIENLSLEWSEYLKQKQVAKAEVLRDSHGAVKEWMRKKVEGEKNFEFEEIKELEEMAEKCKDQRLYDQSIGTYKKLITKYQIEQKKLKGKGETEQAEQLDFRIGECYYQIGYAYDLLGKLDQSLENYTKSLEIQISYLGDENHISLDSTYMNIGIVYGQQGLQEKALEHYNKAVQIKIAHYGDENHFELAATYNNIGEVYRELGQLDKALLHFNKSMQIKIKHYGGENHFELVEAYMNIGAVYYSQGQHDKALKNFHKTIQLMKTHYGDENHFALAPVYGNIGGVYNDQRQLGKGLEMYEKSLRIAINHYGKDNINLAPHYFNIALLSENLEDFTKAAQNMEEAYNLCFKYYGAEYEKTKQALKDLNYYKSQLRK